MSLEWTMVVMLAVTIAAAVYVAWPLLTGGTPEVEFLGSEASAPVLQRLLFQRDTIYAAMKELEFDLAMGNLSQPDFETLQDRYKKKAVAVLKRIDDAKAGKLPARGVLEAEEEFLADSMVAARDRRSHQARPATDLDVEQEIQSFRRQSRERNGRSGAGSTACPSCGHRIKDSHAAFCSKCGAPVRGQSK